MPRKALWNAFGGRSRKLKRAAYQYGCRQGNHPTHKAAARGIHILFEPPMEALAIAEWDIGHTLIAVKLNYIFQPRKYGGTTIASLGVLFDRFAQIGRYLSVNVIGTFSPHQFAIYSHGLFPFANDSLVVQPPPNPGLSRSRSIRRARRRRVFTEAVEMSNIFAVSSMLKRCMSRSTKTSRYFSARVASAFMSAS